VLRKIKAQITTFFPHDYVLRKLFLDHQELGKLRPSSFHTITFYGNDRLMEMIENEYKKAFHTITFYGNDIVLGRP